MSERGTEHVRLSADERYELALAGDASARRNRPSHLVVIAGAVFIAACAALGFTSCRASEAADDLDRRTSQRDEIATLLAQLAAAEARGTDPTAALTAPYTGFRSTMEELASEVGIGGSLPFPKEDRRPDIPGANRVTFQYTITNDELEPLLMLLRRATEEIPGTHIASLRVVPRREQWEMSTTFERWERTN
jgi:hypothetical protein